MADLPKDPKARPRLLCLITVDWFFVSHFLERAEAARRAVEPDSSGAWGCT